MPIVAMPDGTQVEFPDDMSREQIRAMILKKFPDADPKIGGKTQQFARGVAQGAVLDPIEGIGQLVERAIGRKIGPQVVRDWLKDVRAKTEATTAGTAGRWTGAIGSLAVAPEAAIARVGGLTRLAQLAVPAGSAERLLRREQYATVLGKRSALDLTNAERSSSDLGLFPIRPTRARRVAGQAATGAAVGAAQPVEGDDENFATQKALQALTGGALGGLAGTRVGEVVGRHLMRHPYHYGFFPALAAVHNPAHALPTLGGLGLLAAQYMAERAGPRIAAPIGSTTGRVFSGSPSEEAPNAETETQ